MACWASEIPRPPLPFTSMPASVDSSGLPPAESEHEHGCDGDCGCGWSMKLTKGAKRRQQRRMALLSGDSHPAESAGMSSKEANEKLSILKVHAPEPVMALSHDAEDRGWEIIEIGVDSGASETVIPPEEIKNVLVTQGDQAKKGIKYETDSGDLLPNLGEKGFVGSSEHGILRYLTAQVADVNQPLLAVRKIMKAGHRVVFDDEYSYIEDKSSGDVMGLEDDGSMFILKLWCRKPGRADCETVAPSAASLTKSRPSFHRQE